MKGVKRAAADEFMSIRNILNQNLKKANKQNEYYTNTKAYT